MFPGAVTILRCVRLLSAAASVLLIATCCPEVTQALPFNDDMVMTPKLRTGSSVRDPVPGTIARGSLAYRVETREEALALENPTARELVSTRRGKMLYVVNCSPCHGSYNSKGENTPNPVAITKMIAPGPPLNQEIYKNETDSFYYATIHFGSRSTLMPALGYKLSAQETWDIVNYVRSLQE